MKSPADRHFALRGSILGFLFLLLCLARAFSDRPLRPEALALLALAAAWRLWAGRAIGAHSNGLRMEGPVLAVHGPYAWGRHPLYHSNILAAAGLLLFANALTALAAMVFLAVVFVHHAFLARWEEERMASLHGESWRVYREVTPRWIGLPRKRVTDPSATEVPSWAGAFRRQGFNLAKPGLGALILWAVSFL